PRFAAVDRGVDRELGAEVKKVFVGHVFAQAACRAHGQAAADRRPGLAVVVGHHDPGVVVVGAVGVEDDVGAAVGEARGFDGGDPARAGQAHLVGDVGPLLPAVARDPEVAVVGAGPEDVRVAGRFGDGGAAAARRPRDLRRNDLRVLALLHRAEDVLARAVEDLRVVIREDVGRVPVEAVLLFAFGACDAEPLGFAGAEIAAHHAAVLALGVDQVGIVRIDAADVAVAAVDG